MWLTDAQRTSEPTIRPPDVILRRSFTRPFTALAVIEGLAKESLVSFLVSGIKGRKGN